MEISYLKLERMHQGIRKELDELWNNVIDRNWFLLGQYLAQFEEEFAKYCGTKYCIGVGNGLDAIRLILEALEIGEGDEVIVPANTFIATILAITAVRATPILVDASLEDLNIDSNLIETKISKNTKAIIAVHLYGRVANMRVLVQIAKKYKIFLIEDAAQAHGAMQDGKRAGSFGDAAAFSFYPGKNLGAIGDAGGVVTNNVELASKIKMLRNYGSKKKYVHEYLGCNSRMDELQAGVLSIKLKYLDKWNKERQEIAEKYNKKISLPNIELEHNRNKNAEEMVYHIYPILYKERNALKVYLEEKGIETNIHYPLPISNQNAYLKMNWDITEYPITDKICKEELSLPLYPGMAEEEINYVIEIINTFCE